MSSSPESALLRGPSAAQAPSYLEALARPRLPLREAAVQVQPEPVSERRTTIRRAADQPVDGPRTTFRLGDVYAEELARLREHAHAEGYAAGFAEGTAAAESVVAEAERAAAERLAEVQARWERRMASATAALGAAVRRLDEAAVPLAEEVRDSVLGAATTLVEDVLGRELQLATSPGLDAVRRALVLCPADAPAVVRLHPDDLAEIPAEALAALPESVTVLGDERIERAGAVAETGSQRVDAQIGAALERVQAVLRP
ncbi:MAG: Flagellar assembly protein FliH/Type secretion system HrpE [Frankiales bacterium]|nr:Flagellar assembly protein FliH/Type secretion system HrpE [Frankiales bacterium]